MPHHLSQKQTCRRRKNRSPGERERMLGTRPTYRPRAGVRGLHAIARRSESVSRPSRALRAPTHVSTRTRSLVPRRP